MAKPVRSPLTGYNHNVQHLGRVFHVQTEDSGPVNPHIFTHLFFGGTILVSKKHRYDAATPDDTVRKLMQAQHKAMLRELLQQQHDERIRGFFAAKGEVLEASPGAQPAVVVPVAEVSDAVPGAIPAEPLPSGGSPSQVRAAVRPGDSGPLRGASVTPGPTPPPARPARQVAMPGTTPGPTPPPVHAGRQSGHPAAWDPGPTPPPRAAPSVIVTPAPVVVTPAPVARPPAAGRTPPTQTNPRLPQGGKPASTGRSNPNVVTTSSADGVVVQRSVVVGGGRGRREPRPTAAFRTPTAPAGMPITPATQGRALETPLPVLGEHTQTVSTPAWGASLTPGPAVTPAPVVVPAPAVTSAPVRPIGPLVDDKSLDEVILEYLADDGVDEGLG